LFPALLVSAAALEEVLFRGVLVELSLSLRSPALTATCLLASLLAFALTHVALGWAEVFAKLPLGALALISVLLLPSVVPAILAHVLFNLHAWRATT
jgi:membrane protease YdiL (CAAX protease family)